MAEMPNGEGYVFKHTDPNLIFDNYTLKYDELRRADQYSCELCLHLDRNKRFYSNHFFTKYAHMFLQLMELKDKECPVGNEIHFRKEGVLKFDMESNERGYDPTGTIHVQLIKVRKSRKHKQEPPLDVYYKYSEDVKRTPDKRRKSQITYRRWNGRTLREIDGN